MGNVDPQFSLHLHRTFKSFLKVILLSCQSSIEFLLKGQKRHIRFCLGNQLTNLQIKKLVRQVDCIQQQPLAGRSGLQNDDAFDLLEVEAGHQIGHHH